jgi:hypothetical protein
MRRFPALAVGLHQSSQIQIRQRGKKRGMHAKAFGQEFFLWPVRLFSWLVEALARSALALLLPLAPLTCALLSGRWQYLKHDRLTLGRSARYLRALAQARVVSRNLRRKLTLQEAEKIEGHCTHCGRCCVNRSCVFLDWREDGSSHCAIYNNWFWKWTSCGGYPVDAQSIATYSCPSFKSVPIQVVARRP